MKRLALVLLPALALAAPDPEGLGTWIVPRVAFDCRLFEVLPGKAATVPDGFVPAGRAVKWKRGTIPAGMLRSFFDGSFEAMEGVSLAWSGSLEASRFSPARVSVPLPPSAASTRKLDLSVSASHSDVANAARFDVGFAFRDAGTADEPSAAVPEETGDSGLVPGDSGFGIVLRGSSGPVDPDVLLAIGNWRLAGFERVPVRPVGLDELRPRYVALAALAVQGADRLAEALCRDFEDPAGHGAALAWIAEAANALGSSDPHPPADAPFLSDAGYVEALVAVGLAAFCESDWHDETSFEAILGIWAPHAPRSLRAHALARYAGQGNPLPAPRNLPAWRWGRPNRFEGDSPEARRALSGLAESVIPHFDGNRDCTADVVFGLFPEQMPALAGFDRRDSLPAVAGSAVPAVAERAALVERAILHAEEAAEADAAGYPAVRRPPPGAVEGLFLLAEPVRTPAVHAAGEPILFDVVLSNAGPFSVTVEETSPRVEYRFDGRRPLDWPDDGLLELTRRFWTELPPGAVGNRARLDLSDWVSNDVPRRVRAPLRRDLDLAGTRWAETEVEFEILSAAAPATNAPAATLEQLLAEPWRKRLSPDADPVAEMRKIGTLDTFADCWVLFLARGLDWGRLKNDSAQIALARARSEKVRAMFRCARPAVGVDFERGGRERSIAFNKLPRETDEKFPKPVRAVPFEFYGFAPADAADDFVVRLPGDDDRWVLVPGLGAFAMPEHAAENTRPAEFAESEPHAEGAENAETKPHAESAENAEPKPHAESAEGAENGFRFVDNSEQPATP